MEEADDLPSEITSELVLELGELLYGGNAHLIPLFLQEAGRPEFEETFAEKAETSPWWPALRQLNRLD